MFRAQWRLEHFTFPHFMCVALTAALGSCSNSWHVMCSHYAYVCGGVPRLCLITAYMGLSQYKPGLSAKHWSSVITSVFPLTLYPPPPHSGSLSLGDKEASHFMWRIEVVSSLGVRREAVTAAFSWNGNMKYPSLNSWVMCVILSDVFILLQL